MVKHIVMWKLKDFSEAKTKAENAEIMKEMLEALKGEIDEIQEIEVGINILPGEQAYDVVLNSEFNTMEDLVVYQKHPKHVKVGEYVRKVVDKRASADYEK